MKGFLDRTETFLLANEFEDENDHLLASYRKIRQLQQVQAKSYLDLDNVEDVFSALEMAELIEQFLSFSQTEISEIKAGLVDLIVKTLEHSVGFPLNTDQPRKYEFRPDFSYIRFLNWFIASEAQPPAIITFNYDVALDYAIYTKQLDNVPNFKVNYCLDPKETGGIKLLKLHGSINWGRCSECNESVPYYFDSFLNTNNDMLKERSQSKGHAIFEFSRHLNELQASHEHKTAAFTPVIVPPTWLKGEHHASIRQVWKTAANELNDAREIYVIGYSLPETDTFFRHLFALGTISPTKIQKLWVYNPDHRLATFNRFSRIVGTDIKARFRYFPVSLEKYFENRNQRINEKYFGLEESELQLEGNEL